MPGVDPMRTNFSRMIAFDSLTKDTVIDMPSRYKMSPLHEALWFDNNDEAQEIIEEAKEEKELKGLLRTYDRDGRSPLFYAIIRRNIPMVKLLIEEGSPIEYIDGSGVNALMYACFYGFKEAVDMLLAAGAKVEVWTKGKYPINPLLITSAKGYVQILAKLLEKEVDLNAVFRLDNDSYNALMVALHSEEIDNLPVRQAICELLVTHDVKTFVARADGITPLMLALDQEMTDFAKMLVEKDLARVDKVANDKCTTALWIAMYRKNVELVKSLFDQECNINTGVNRSTPLHAAVISNFPEGVKMLLDRDHQPMPVDAAGFTPVHYAACLQDTRCLETLLTKQINIEVRAKRSGFTPLHVAALRGNIPGMNLLLEHNADIEVVDKKDGLTPLIATMMDNRVEATKFLIEKGASIMGRRYKTGITPLVNAIGLQRDAIRDLILEKTREKPDKQGELKKQGGGHRSKAYKKRYFILYGTYLCYYKTAAALEPQGMIILDKGKLEKIKGSAFNLTTPHRTYVVQAKNDEERQEWMDALQAAIDSYDAEKAPNSSSFTMEGKRPELLASVEQEQSAATTTTTTTTTHARPQRRQSLLHTLGQKITKGD